MQKENLEATTIFLFFSFFIFFFFLHSPRFIAGRIVYGQASLFICLSPKREVVGRRFTIIGRPEGDSLGIGQRTELFSGQPFNGRCTRHQCSHSLHVFIPTLIIYIYFICSTRLPSFPPARQLRNVIRENRGEPKIGIFCRQTSFKFIVNRVPEERGRGEGRGGEGRGEKQRE